jgi:Condensation domain
MTLSSETPTLQEAARLATIPAAFRAAATTGQPPAAPPVPTDRVTVAVAGEGAGVGEFTWGQRVVWSTMVRYGWIPIGSARPQPPGRTVQDVADELQFMFSRFPALRTKVRFDADSRPSQELLADGEFTFEVYDADGDADPQETASAVYQHYVSTTRDFVNEWPLRIAVIRRDGMVTHMVSLICHLATDGGGIVVLYDEIATRPTEPPTCTQQLELAHWQGSPAGRRQSATALSHVETALRSVPPRLLPSSTDRREPRHWVGNLTSAALGPAVQAIADRTRADPSAVLMTLYAVALGRRDLLNPAVLRPVVNNRFRPGLRKIVSNVASMGVCVLDVSEMTVDEAVGRTRRAARSAYKYAFYDPQEEEALIDRIAQENPDDPRWGTQTWSLFNDRRTRRLPAATEELHDLLAHTEFRWIGTRDTSVGPVFLNIDDSPQGLLLMVLADTWHVSPADGEGLLRDIEEVAVAAANDPKVPTKVAARGGS